MLFPCRKCRFLLMKWIIFISRCYQWRQMSQLLRMVPVVRGFRHCDVVIITSGFSNFDKIRASVCYYLTLPLRFAWLCSQWWFISNTNNVDMRLTSANVLAPNCRWEIFISFSSVHGQLFARAYTFHIRMSLRLTKPRKSCSLWALVELHGTFYGWSARFMTAVVPVPSMIRLWRPRCDTNGVLRPHVSLHVCYSIETDCIVLLIK